MTVGNRQIFLEREFWSSKAYISFASHGYTVGKDISKQGQPEVYVDVVLKEGLPWPPSASSSSPTLQSFLSLPPSCLSQRGNLPFVVKRPPGGGIRASLTLSLSLPPDPFRKVAGCWWGGLCQATGPFVSVQCKQKHSGN